MANPAVLPVLIVAGDPMTGALLGTLVEVSGFKPVFPAGSEDAAAAIARVRPTVVLVDCDSGDEERCNALAAEYRSGVILFSGSRTAPEVRDIAARRGQRHFALPIRWTEFRALLEDVARRERPG